MPSRFLLLGLSLVGMVAAGALWFTGHGLLAGQVLAGDVLVIFLILLAS